MSPAGSGARTGTLAVALVLAGCASATPTPSPTQNAPSASASAAASATAAPSPTAESPTPASPTPTETELSSPSAAPPSATPAAPSTLTIRWVNPPGASGLDDLRDLRASARQGSRFVVVGSKNVGSGDNADCAPAIWWSGNATTWHAATLPAGYEQGGCFITGVAVGGPGFVAVGEGKPLWSADGQAWTEATANGLPATSRLISVGASPTGMIAVGYDDNDHDIAFESGDGKVWSDAPSTAQLLGSSDIVFASGGDGLLAFVIRPNEQAGQTVVLQMEGIGVWRQLATLDGAVQTASFGSKGWLAASDGAAWLSPHGVNWTTAPTAPKGYADAAIVDTSGFVVVNEIIPPGCAIDESEIVGQTWTSVDGLDWHKMKMTWTGRWLNALFDVGSTLVGVGQAHETTEFGFVRTADLPAGPLAAGPAPTPAPTATPNEGCG